MGPSSGPQILIFKHFKYTWYMACWSNNVVADYKSGVKVAFVTAALLDVSAEVTDFCINHLELKTIDICKCALLMLHMSTMTIESWKQNNQIE